MSQQRPKGEGEAADRVIAAAMALAAERGWHDLSLVEIARRAELPLSELYTMFPCKPCILAVISERAETAVLAEDDPEAAGEPARERLFDVLMRRFDALQAYRTGLARVIEDLPRDPLATAAALWRTERSMALMLEAAGLSAEGARGILRVKGLTAVYLATLRVWREDETPDMAATMAALDRYLRRIEGPAAALERVRRPRREEEAEA